MGRAGMGTAHRLHCQQVQPWHVCAANKNWVWSTELLRCSFSCLERLIFISRTVQSWAEKTPHNLHPRTFRFKSAFTYWFTNNIPMLAGGVRWCLIPWSERRRDPSTSEPWRSSDSPDPVYSRSHTYIHQMNIGYYTAASSQTAKMIFPASLLTGTKHSFAISNNHLTDIDKTEALAGHQPKLQGQIWG